MVARTIAGVRLKMDPPKKVPPGPFSTVENRPPVHFSPLKMDPPCVKWGSIFNLTPTVNLYDDDKLIAALGASNVRATYDAIDFKGLAPTHGNLS